MKQRVNICVFFWVKVFGKIFLYTDKDKVCVRLMLQEGAVCKKFIPSNKHKLYFWKGKNKVRRFNPALLVLFMKRKIVLLLTLIFTFSFLACTGADVLPTDVTESVHNNETIIIETSDWVTKDDTVYAEIPFIQFIEKLGADVQWEDNTIAKISYNKNDYQLNLETIELTKMNKDVNLIMPTPGSTLTYHVLDKDIAFDNITTKSILRDMGTDLIMTIDKNSNRVICEVVA